MHSSQIVQSMVAAVLLSWLTAFAAPEQAPGPSRPPSADEGCIPVRYKHDFIAVEAVATGSGRHCLVEDLVQRSMIDLDNGRSTGKPNHVIDFFYASDLDLDLQGHLVSIEPFENATGVALEQTSSIGPQMPHGLAVRNGTIRAPGVRGVGVYLGFNKGYALEVGFYAPVYETVDEDATTMSREISGQLGGETRISYGDPWDYKPPTRFTLSNLTIQAGGRGVIMTGAQNVLKDSTIEVDGDTAVYLYGPGTVVEGNTFILHLDAKYPYPARLPAALKLRDAEGAVIRNNRFIVKGRWPWSHPQASAAINLLASHDVVIENNVVENTRELLRKDDASTVVERDNQVK